MKKLSCVLALLLAAGAVSAASTEEAPPPSGEEKPALQLTQRLGFGTDTIPLAYSYSYNSFYMSDLNAISVRYWLSETIAVEVLGTYRNYSNQGIGFDGGFVLDPVQNWGAGLGLKFNLRRPVPNLFIQALLRASYARGDNQSSNYSTIQTSNNETLGAFAGIGFEYFIPFVDSLSVESCIGYMFATSYSTGVTRYNPSVYTYGDSDYGRTTLYNDIVIRGLTPTTISVHFYF
jgi:hypothetical protein